MSIVSRILNHGISRRFCLTLVALGIVATACVVLFIGRNPPTPLPEGITAQDVDIARRSFQEQYHRSPDDSDTMSWLAEWYLSRSRPELAIVCFNQIKTEHLIYGGMARYQQGRTLLSLHRATEAESQFRELLGSSVAMGALSREFLIDARQRLRHILEVELRFEERHEHLKGVMERGEADHFEIIAGCFPSLLRWNGSQAITWTEEFYAADPHSEVIRTALGRYRTGQGRLEESKQLLETIVADSPQNLPAVAALIACLRAADETDEVERRIKLLPPQSSDEPWLLLLQRGISAIDAGDGQAAIIAYEQVIKSDRTSTQAWQGLANAARITGDQPKRDRAINMARGLGRIQNHVDKVVKAADDPAGYLDVAELCLELELYQEAWVLTQRAQKLAPHDQRVESTLKRIKPHIRI